MEHRIFLKIEFFDGKKNSNEYKKCYDRQNSVKSRIVLQTLSIVELEENAEVAVVVFENINIQKSHQEY